ncbi:Fic family protein [Microbacterium sp. A93]|uniref:Fic family protein n=1 Tax=Microbacterium sp. A93 TaxID=3450716 RepID=UPI003F42C8D6
MTSLPHGDERQEGAASTPGDWPAVDWEDQSWVPTASWGVAAGRQIVGVPYRSALPPMIAHRSPRLSPPVLRAAGQATLALTRLDSKLGERVASFAPVLLRSEAAASSQIENLTASARSIFSAEMGAPSGRNAQMIAANAKAMEAAVDMAETLTVDSIRTMHAVLLEGIPRHTPGSWRQEAVWIGRRSDSPVGAEFVAPHHGRIPELAQDLVAFGRRDDVEPLVLVALAHAQFETIHPFTDGNGRTGRALAQALLRAHQVTRNVAVPVSAGLLADVEGYHGALTAYREGDLVPIVEAFARAALRAVRNVEQLVVEIDEIRETWGKRLKARSDSNAWRVLDILTRYPVLNSASAAEQLGVQQPNVYPPMNTLEKSGIVTSKSVHRQGPFWRSDEVLAAIDRFAERAGRREHSSM